MFTVALILMALNILFLLFFYLKLKSKFSDKTSISKIRTEASRLLADIAFQTDRAVTIMEDKLNEMNKFLSEIDNRILIASQEEQKRLAELEIMQKLEQQTVKSKPKTNSKKETVNSEKVLKSEQENHAVENQNINRSIQKEFDNFKPENENEPINIYTKQILLNKASNNLQKENSMQEQIIEMARNGFSIELIAEKVPLPIGEIELIISMNN